MSEDKEKLKTDRRRQEYWRKRRTIERMRREGSRLWVDGMTHAQLWDTLGNELYAALAAASDSVNVELYRALAECWTCYAAIRERGVQLTLM